MGYVIAFVSQKGGVGKSTMSRALAREAAQGGMKVKLADLDVQQGTSMEWNRKRLRDQVQPEFSVELFNSAEKALAQAEAYDLLVIDAPARASKGTQDIAWVADLVVQPTGPSADDLFPAVLVFRELEKAKVPKEKLVFAINSVLTDAEEVAAREYLQKAGYAVLDGYLPSKTSYRDAQNQGRSITETRYPALNKKADGLIQSLIDRIAAHG